MPRIILASTSPRRQQLLQQLNLDFEVDVRGLPEEKPGAGNPVDIVSRLCLQKANSVAKRYKEGIVIAADTVGSLDGTVFGKPADELEAAKILTMLSGRCHQGITALCVIDTSTGKSDIRVAETQVCFRILAQHEIEGYVRSGEWKDKAGAYAIQGLGAALVKEIHGDYSNVVGLPLAVLVEVLKQYGVDVLSRNNPGFRG